MVMRALGAKTMAMNSTSDINSISGKMKAWGAFRNEGMNQKIRVA